MAGPTVLEVFNTLLKHLRMSVDFELGDSSRRNSASSVSSIRGKESEERIVQNAIIQTIGTSSSITPECVCLNEHVPACVSKNNLECQRFFHSLSSDSSFSLVASPPGFFGGNLPDYQRAEVMMFIMGKVPVYGTPCHALDTVKIGWVTHSLSRDPEVPS